MVRGEGREEARSGSWQSRALLLFFVCLSLARHIRYFLHSPSFVLAEGVCKLSEEITGQALTGLALGIHGRRSKSKMGKRAVKVGAAFLCGPGESLM